MILEPIYRFTDTAAVPMKALYFTKNTQYLSVSQNSQKLNLTQFNAVRGPTQEMFLKDLNCGIDTCQNLPFKVISVFNIIDSKGRLKFETNPSESETVLGKAGYLATEEIEGLIRYDEYYSEDFDMFAYTNGRYPNQFGACQLRDYGRLRYKFVRTLGYAFTAVTIPDNLPIYSIFGFDDGLPEPPTTTLSPSQYVFKTNPIWNILKNSTNGTQGVGSINLPWSPPVSASPIKPTNVCLLNGNISILSTCGYVDRVLQFYDNQHVYIGFIESIYGSVETFIYSYIGYAFKSEDNVCGIPLEPIQEMYKPGVGFTVVAGDSYSDLTSQGFKPTGKIIGYTIDCKHAPNGEYIVTIPDGITTVSSSFSSITPASSSPIGFYVEPVKIISPPEQGGEQGYWLDPENSSPPSNVLETSNVCVFTANNTVIPECGYARNLYLYYDTEDNFYFVSLYTFGRNVTGKVIGIAFETAENSCGLNLVPIRELYKTGVGYQVIAGDNYSSLISNGFNITGNIVGYTVDCKDSKDDFVYGNLPDYEFSTIPTDSSVSTPSGSSESEPKSSPTSSVHPTTPTSTLSTEIGSSISTEAPNSTEITSIYVIPLYNVSSVDGGTLGTASYNTNANYNHQNMIPVCLLSANETFLPYCGDARPLYEYYDFDEKFFFVSIESFGRRVSSRRIGTAFASAENICGLKLKPMRELYKKNVGYTVVAGNNTAKLISQGYVLTGNILGYTVRCKEGKEKMLCINLPSNWTTTTSSTTTPTTSTPTTPITTPTTQKPTTTPYNLTAALPKLDCNTIENYGDLRWRMVQFSRYMEVGDNFTMTGHVWRNASESSLNLYIGLNPKWLQSKISIHMNMRWWRSDIIYNYFWGKWDYAYETYSRRPFTKGSPYVLSIVRGNNYYNVYHNGELIKKYWMVGDVRKHLVGGMMGFREWTIDMVRMDCYRPPSTVSVSTVTSKTTVTTTQTASSKLTSTEEKSSTSLATFTPTESTTSTPTTLTSITPTTTLKTTSTPSTSTTATTKITTSSPSSTKTISTTPTSTIPTTTHPSTTTPYNLTAPLPILDCNKIEFYGDLRWRAINFGRAMEVGDNITLTGHIWNNATQSNINFYLGSNPKFGTSLIPVHMSQRWASSRNIYNNYWYKWGAEAYSSRPFSRGAPFVLSMVKTSNSHRIYGNGQLLINFYYRGTAAQNAIGSLIAYNDWTIDTVTMDCARPPTTTSTSTRTTTSTTVTTPSTTVTSTTKPTTASCSLDQVTLGKGDSNNPQFAIDVSSEVKSPTSLLVYCQGLSTYNIYMLLNENQGGPPPTIKGYMEIQLECALIEDKYVWAFFGREISAVSCTQTPG